MYIFIASADPNLNLERMCLLPRLLQVCVCVCVGGWMGGCVCVCVHVCDCVIVHVCVTSHVHYRTYILY